MRKFLVLSLTLSLITFSQNTYAWYCLAPQSANVTGPTTLTAANFAACTSQGGTVANATMAEKAKNQCSANYFACVVAVLAAAQAVIMIAEALGSKDTANASQCQGDFCGGTGGTEPGAGVNPTGPVNPYTYNPGGDPNDPNNIVRRQAQRTLNEMRDRGYEVDGDGNVKTPKNGTMSGAEIAAAAAAMTPAERAALGIPADTTPTNTARAGGNNDGNSETGGGGGRRGGSGGDGGAGFDMNAYMRSLMGDPNGGRGVAGLSVRAGNDNIGVRESNIFEQVSRAYNNDRVLNRQPIGP